MVAFEYEHFTPNAAHAVIYFTAFIPLYHVISYKLKTIKSNGVIKYDTQKE